MEWSGERERVECKWSGERERVMQVEWRERESDASGVERE